MYVIMMHVSVDREKTAAGQSLVTYAGFGAYGISNGSRRFQLDPGYIWRCQCNDGLSGESITECFILYVRTLGKIVW